jgi:hypothetical protein
MTDYGRVAWSKTKKKIDDDRIRKGRFLKEFSNLWCRHGVFASLVDERPIWKLTGALRSNQP